MKKIKFMKLLLIDSFILDIAQVVTTGHSSPLQRSLIFWSSIGCILPVLTYSMARIYILHKKLQELKIQILVHKTVLRTLYPKEYERFRNMEEVKELFK